MNKSTTIKLRVPTDTVKAWKGKALEVGMTLSEWIRYQCDEPVVATEAHGVGTERTHEPGNVATLSATVATKPKSVERRHVPVCFHGKEKGTNCWQCGGLAKIEV